MKLKADKFSRESHGINTDLSNSVLYVQGVLFVYFLNIIPCIKYYEIIEY